MCQTRFLLALTIIHVTFWTACDRFPNRISISHDDSSHSFTRCYISQIGDKDIEFGLSNQEIANVPSWSPKQPLPIALQDVAVIAEKELPKYTHGTQGWYVSGITIEQIRRSADGNDKWIYLVHFGGIGDGDYVRIPIFLSGKAIPGREKPHDKSHDQH